MILSIKDISKEELAVLMLFKFAANYWMANTFWDSFGIQQQACMSSTYRFKFQRRTFAAEKQDKEEEEEEEEASHKL